MGTTRIPPLGDLASMTAAASTGCAFGLDLGYSCPTTKDSTRTRRGEVPRWRGSSAFTPLERRVMECAEGMCTTPVTVTDELADGGGIKQTLPRPVQGADEVAKLYRTGLTRFAGRVTVESMDLNGWPALLPRLDGEVDSVLTFAVLDGRITGLYGVRNPEKLSRLTGETVLTR